MRRGLYFTICLLATLSSYSQEAANYTETISGVPIKMIYIKGGTFTMGSPGIEYDRGYLEAQHFVTLSDYYIAEFEITQKQWKSVMGNNPSFFKDCENCPVEFVNWNEAQEFVTKLSQLANKTYTLPTEAQWEYACRAGTKTAFSTGSCLDANQANYDGNSAYTDVCPKGAYKQKTTPVGSYKPNAWGLSDMHGNVHEWCSDWYGPYPKEDQKDPVGPATGTFRIVRGGNWDIAAKHCRSASRNYFTPEYRGRNVGFRIVCIIPPTE
jgi:formylglycine-generating enzyme required for sulfatase activity